VCGSRREFPGQMEPLTDLNHAFCFTKALAPTTENAQGRQLNRSPPGPKQQLAACRKPSWQHAGDMALSPCGLLENKHAAMAFVARAPGEMLQAPFCSRLRRSAVLTKPRSVLVTRLGRTKHRRSGNSGPGIPNGPSAAVQRAGLRPKQSAVSASVSERPLRPWTQESGLASAALQSLGGPL